MSPEVKYLGLDLILEAHHQAGSNDHDRYTKCYGNNCQLRDKGGEGTVFMPVDPVCNEET